MVADQRTKGAQPANAHHREPMVGATGFDQIGTAVYTEGILGEPDEHFTASTVCASGMRLGCVYDF
jgi:hypothetical protein